jgi:glutathione synthase/RimK-type ligase-like ATP-grasp enzyme
MAYSPLSLDILRQACALSGDRFEIVDSASSFLARVSRGEHFFFADAGLGTVYPLNSHFAAELARDKAYTADVLKAAGVAGIEGARFYADAADGGRYAKDLGPAAALRYAEALGYPLFAKLNRGAHGRLARRIEDADALIAYMREARAVEHMFLLQPLIEQPEARLYILDGRVRFLYRRDRARLTGDGARTIAELIAAHAADPRLAADPTGLDAVADLTKALSRARRALGDVPAKGEAIYAADAANLAQGGHLEALDLAPSEAVQVWAQKVAHASGLRILGADVFFERLDDPSTYRAIELNANPSLSGLWRAGGRDPVIGIWRDVLDRYFGSRGEMNVR